MADLSTYQNQANAVYQPQQQAEGDQLTQTKNANIATLEGQKGQIQTDYATAVQNLTNTTNQNVGQINQLYTNRLGGNFSGLQGNDLGNMFSRAQQVQGNIESTRANKLNGINTEETNATNQFNSLYNGLASKYQGLKADYANKAYATDVKQQQAQQLAYAKLAASSARSANSPLTQSQTVAAIRAQLDSVKGGDSHVAPQDLASAYKDFAGSGLNPNDFWKYFQGYWNPNQGDYSNQFYKAAG